MLNGLLPETCRLVADNIRTDQYGERAEAYDLIEYGCEGDNRVEIKRQRMETTRLDPYGLQMSQLAQIIDGVNRMLRQRSDCGCARRHPY